MGRIRQGPRIHERHRTDKNQFRTTVNNVIGSVKTGGRKIINWVKQKAIHWFKKYVNKENIEKVGRFASGLSDAVRTTTGAVRDIGGVVGGKVGDRMQRGADYVDKKHDQIRDYAEDKIDRGRRIYDIGRNAYERVRQNMKA